jgi:secreted Zn-dependent insulinase-like peptidase
MLFLGSKKYPDSDEYNNFFSKHGGYTNAWTDDDYTTYNFDIAEHEEFYNALDRTTEFFISPLFTEKYVDKELNAVDSEFKMDFQDDSWRYWSVMG